MGINPSGAKYRKSCALDRLHSWMDYLGYHHYSFSNVIPETGDYKKSMVDYSFVKEQTLGHNKIIALGGFVSDVFKKINAEHFKMPHPSPLNRMLNSKEYELKMLQECRRYMCK